MITAITITAMIESLATAYGKNGFPCAFRIEYSRRYCSFSCWFMTRSGWAGSKSSDLGLVQLRRLFLDRLEPGRRGDPELGDQVQVGADQGGDQPRYQHHVDRVEPR